MADDNNVVENADRLAEMIAGDFDVPITGTDLLDLLATAGLNLVVDADGAASLAYYSVLGGLDR